MKCTPGPVAVLLLSVVLSAGEGTLLEIAKISTAVLKELWDVYQWAAEELVDSGGPGLPFGDREVLASRIRELAGRMDRGELLARRSEEVVYAQIARIPAAFRYELQVHTLLEEILNIERADRTFKDYLWVGLKKLNGSDLANSIEDHTLMDFLQTVTSHQSDSVRSSMDKIHQLIAGGEGRAFLNRIGLFNIFLNYIKILITELKKGHAK